MASCMQRLLLYLQIQWHVQLNTRLPISKCRTSIFLLPRSPSKELRKKKDYWFMALSGSTKCYNYWHNIEKNYDNRENSQFFHCMWYVYWSHRSNPMQTWIREDKVKACQFERSSKNKVSADIFAWIPKLKKNAVKVYCIKDSET